MIILDLAKTHNQHLNRTVEPSVIPFALGDVNPYSDLIALVFT